MVGGTVVQVVTNLNGTFVEVLDGTSMDRLWRKIEPSVDIRIGDNLWWQSYQGRLSRPDQFKDKAIGSCKPANPHGRP